MATQTQETKEDKKGFAGFDPKNVSEEVLGFMKSSFDATFDNVVKIQDLNEKMLKDMIEKSKEIQADSLAIVNDFIENAKKGRDEYRKVIEDGFKNMTELARTQQ